MSKQFNPFKFNAVKDFKTLTDEINEMNLNIQHSKNTELLFKPVTIKMGKNTGRTFKLANRLAIHPMEGCDGTADGNPSELTKLRYKNFGNSGASIIWFEATAITSEARANPRQIMINKSTIPSFKELVQISLNARKDLFKENPDLPVENFDNPLKIIQLTHSGRYSRPKDKKNPLRAFKYDDSDVAFGIDPASGSIVSDKYLDELKQKYLDAIGYSEEAGFDGVDIKSCHRYLMSELLSGFTRENSKYGGEAFENRTRLLVDIVDSAVKEYPKMIITARLNIYDGLAYPYGFGVKKDSKIVPPESDPSEPVKLIKILHEKGVNLINFTVGNPYFKPYISRPYDLPSYGTTPPPEHPLTSINRVISIERSVNQAIPEDVKVIGTAFSWFRQWAPYIAAGEIERNSFDIIGFGRMSFANPMFPVQIYKNGVIDHSKSCLACSKCTDLMRFDSTAGCPIRNPRVYAKIYGQAKRTFLKKN